MVKDWIIKLKAAHLNTKVMTHPEASLAKLPESHIQRMTVAMTVERELSIKYDHSTSTTSFNLKILKK